MSRPRIVLYPFFVALYSVLALAAKNVQEVVWLNDLTRPLGIVLAAAAVAWLISRFVASDLHVRALVTLVMVVWFAYYGYFDQFLVQQPWLAMLSPHKYAIPVLLFLLSAIALIIVRSQPRPLHEISRYLNVTMAILLVFSVVTIARHRELSSIQGSAVATPSVRVAVAERASRPDIYVIVLDEYTGTRSLARNYSFDNRPFADSLLGMGFFVPSAPQSNYVHTHLALASFLNWQLLEERPAEMTTQDGALQLDYAAIEDNRTWELLHELGYRFVFFPSAYQATGKNRHADLQLPDPRQVTSEFESVWRSTTLVQPVKYWWCRAFGCQSLSPYKPPRADLIDWKFARLGELPDSAGPLFVFAHFVTPHWPYIFDSTCRHREPYQPAIDSGANELPMKRAYVAQIQCANRKVSRLVRELISRSKTAPIIVIQADHGHGRFGRDFPSLVDAGPERVAERIDPFAAYYLPGHPPGVVYDSITPVNVLPRIFNHYFNAGIPLQPDATYWSTWEEPFKFTRIR